MKSVTSFILIGILSITICDAQYFSKHYVPKGYWARSIVQYDDTSYVVLTANYSDTGIAYLKINDTGGVISYNKVGFGNQSQIYTGWSNNIVKLNDNSIVLASTYQSSSGSQKPYIIKFNPNGNIAWSKILNDSGNNLINQTRATADGGFFILGERRLTVSSTDGALILIKVDSLGNEQWHRIYDTPVYDDYVASFEKITDDSFLIGQTYRNSSGTNPYVKGKVFAIDSLGNVYWQNLFNSSKDYGGTCAWHSNQPGGYYYVGGGGYDTIGVNLSNNYPPYVAKVNKIGGVAWRKFIKTDNEQMSLYYIKAYNDNLYFLGFSFDTMLNNGNTTAIFAKFDSLGNLKWRHNYFKYTRAYADNYLSDFVQTKDGGFMLCGSSWDTLNGLNIQSTWILRVDSNGCEVANCLVKDTTGSGINPLTNNNRQLEVYPNPANTNLTISQLANLKMIEVYDVVGRKLEDLKMSRLGNEIQIQVSDLSSGIYFLKATDEKGNVKNAKFVKE